MPCNSDPEPFGSANTPFSLPADEGKTGMAISHRLDSLFPTDMETGTITPVALNIYLNAMMDLYARNAQPLSLLAFAVDTGEETGSLLRRFGAEGANLISRAVGRCLRQETRIHDVVGRVQAATASETPVFLVVCPMLDEVRASRLAERLRTAMNAYGEGPEHPWLTVNVGVAAMSIDTLEPEGLIARSLQALNRARRVEGGCVWRHSDTLRQIAQNQEDTDEFGAE